MIWLRRSFQVGHGNSERVWDVADMLKHGDPAVFDIQTCSPFPEFFINLHGHSPPHPAPVVTRFVRAGNSMLRFQAGLAGN
jgi:hypothetical protein